LHIAWVVIYKSRRLLDMGDITVAAINSKGFLGIILSRALDEYAVASVAKKRECF